MDEKIHKWLYDIKFAIEEIDGYFDNKQKDFFNIVRISCLKELSKEILK